MAGQSRKPLYQKRRDAWAQLLLDTRDEASEEIAQQRIRLLESWRPQQGEPLGEACWRYLSAKDVDGRPIIWTVDERDMETPVKPFPSHKLYLKEIVTELWTYRIVLIDKIRQKYISTLCMLAIDWFCSFYDEREVFVSRIKEESAVKLINDKIRVTHTRKPSWLQQACPITLQPANIITYKMTNSTVTGVAQNFGSGDARGPTASLVVVDEAAFQDLYDDIYGAILPMAARFWAVSTANIGNPGAEAFKRQIFMGRPGYTEEGEEAFSE